MQLAKNLFLGREKTIARKLQEVLLTWWLESALDKASLLELYLNVIEYGPAIYGIRAAATHYFGRSPAELTVAQSAFLACVLPNPKVYGLVYDRGSLTTSATNRVRRLVEHMAARGRIDADSLADGLEELSTLRFARPGAPVPTRTVRGHARPLPTTRESSVDWENATYDADPLESAWGL
jgi:membrane peptidoglycan carboxypeptidase